MEGSDTCPAWHSLVAPLLLLLLLLLLPLLLPLTATAASAVD
jgi:hypothetical protein